MADDAGIAALLSVHPETEDVMQTVYRTDGEHGVADPIAYCKGLRRSCEDDFPGYLWSIASNDRAREIHGERLTAHLLGEKS